jgi:hypothetical protein
VPTTAPQTTIDPLHSFMAGAVVAATRRPIPLVATSFDVQIDGGLAVVATRRVFRNREEESIEATITFPVPVHAALFALQARIDGRLLEARAQRRSEAREIYESAIERGKAAVLHEEVLRGVHMLSVAHIAPGAEIEVTATWAMPLTNMGGRGHLRIPLTVGEIYGRSVLPESDDLSHGGPVQAADLSVQCSDGVVALVGGTLAEGRAQVMLNAPIDLVVTGWTPRDLLGRAADGRAVTLRIEPDAASDAALNAALVVDHSGSMSEICSGESGAASKHQAVISALHGIAENLGAADVIDLWEFNNVPRHVGSTRERTGLLGQSSPSRSLAKLARQLAGPSGGTEIGSALDAIVAESTARDVLLVTDGKSHALDVQALARTGRRFTVVLVGEDSLEANVGHLAALTGGDVFVAGGADLRDVVTAAIRALRTPTQRAPGASGAPRRLEIISRGIRLGVEWRDASSQAQNTPFARAVAAMAAALALPSLDSETAAALAAAEGLVTHLTSLVLVDEAGAVQEHIPAMRKVALPTPRTAYASAAPMPPEAMPAANAGRRQVDVSVAREGGAFRVGTVDRLSEGRPPAAAPAMAPRVGVPPATRRLSEEDLLRSAAMVDWDRAPNRLAAGDLGALGRVVARAVRRAAADAEVVSVARQLGLDPVALIIALMALAQSSANRSAARIARAILGQPVAPAVAALCERFGLQPA